MPEERNWFPLLVIVAIVAIVGLIVAVTGGSRKYVPAEQPVVVSGGAGPDLSGQATGQAQCRTWCCGEWVHWAYCEGNNCTVDPELYCTNWCYKCPGPAVA